MRRRTFIGLLGGAAAWPLTARAQQSMPVIGVLHSARPETSARFVAAFHQGLQESGFVESQNLAIEYRWAEDRYERLPALAEDLVHRKVAVLSAMGGPVAALAAKSASTQVPIVFTAVADPVRSGLVASLNRPGGNVTGNAGLTSELDAKRLELLHEIVPGKVPIGVLTNPNRPGVTAQLDDLRAAAQAIGRQLIVISAGTSDEIDAAFETLRGQGATGLLITADPFFGGRRAQLARLAGKHVMPAIYQLREFAAEGGLASYGPSLPEAYRLTGIYTGRILKGERPSDLPVVQPTKFELVINLKTAKALGIAIPETLLARADEVIE